MEPTTNPNPTTNRVATEKPTGLEDVVRSVRALARTTRDLGEASAEILERELAMAIKISEQIRNDVISAETLEEARKQSLASKVRKDAHDALNLMADAWDVLFLMGSRFIENFIDQPRPELNSQSVSQVSPVVNRL
jgi:hypothetical protein